MISVLLFCVYSDEYEMYGEDGIPAELYKECSSVLVDPIYSILCSKWEKEVCLNYWETTILLPVFKK